MYIKLLFSILALLSAFIFVYIAPNSGIENVVITILTLLGSFLGIQWRKEYDELKGWLSSKTILGALIIVIPIIIVLVILPLLSVNVPDYINDTLYGVVGTGGIMFFIGIINAIIRKAKQGK